MANFFTKQQIDDIRTALASDAKSDLQLPETTEITGDDYVAVIQNGLNKKLNVNTFRDELQNGPQGESTYEIAVRHGYTGTEEEWLNDYEHGAKGPKGDFPDTNADDLNIDSNNRLQLADRTYNISDPNGLGYVILRSNKTFESQVTKANTIYEVRHNFTLSTTFTLPDNVMLVFNGGKINGGKIIFNNTGISSDKECFGTSIQIEGKILNEANPEWFEGNDAVKIEKAINVFGVVRLAARDYLVDRQIEVNHSFKLIGSAFGDFFGEGNDVSGILRDYSRSRIVATDTFNSSTVYNSAGTSVPPALIKVCRGGANNLFYSIHIEGISFVGKNYTGYGLEICTPDGPSRPVNIIGCNFKYLNHAIDINNDGIAGTSIQPTSTNVGVFNLQYSNVTNNNYGLYVSGNHALMQAMIAGNNMEANIYGAIYAMDNTLRPNNTETVPLFNSIRIENNLLEGQAKPISLRAGFNTDIKISGNYFESSNSQEITLQGVGVASRPNIYISCNTSVSNNLEWKISGCTVTIDDHSTDGNEFTVSTSAFYGVMPQKMLKIEYSLFEKNPGNSSSYTEITHYYPAKDSLLRDNECFKQFIGSSGGTVESIALTGSSTLAAGTYRLVSKIFNTNTSNIFGIRFNNVDYTNNIIVSEDVMYYVTDMVLTASTTSAFLLKLKTYASPFYLYDTVVASIPSNNPYIVPSLPDDLHGIQYDDIVNGKYTGATIYDTSIKKDVVWNGTKWSDTRGFTPSISKGATASRPSVLVPLEDDGYNYYDTDIKRSVWATTKEVSTTLTKTISTGETGDTISNPFTEGSYYQINISPNASYMKKVIFRKAVDSETDQIVIISTDTYNVGNVIFKAPSVTTYPYVYFYNGRPSGSNSMTFTVKNVSFVWKEADGAAAGVLRSGTFANKPSADDIYVGFKYFCTDKQTTEGAANGIEIIHKGSGVWVDALGRTIS